MVSKPNSGAIPVLVYFGAIILFGIPTMIISFAVLASVLDSFNIDASSMVIILLGISVLIGLQTAVEATAVQVGGINALKRGSSHITFIRFSLLTMAVFVILVAVLWLGLFATVGGSWPTATIAAGFILSIGSLALSKKFGPFSNFLENDVRKPE